MVICGAVDDIELNSQEIRKRRCGKSKGAER
jgi:hypothetical protein